MEKTHQRFCTSSVKTTKQCFLVISSQSPQKKETDIQNQGRVKKWRKKSRHFPLKGEVAPAFKVFVVKKPFWVHIQKKNGVHYFLTLSWWLALIFNPFLRFSSPLSSAGFCRHLAPELLVARRPGTWKPRCGSLQSLHVFTQQDTNLNQIATGEK